MSEKSSDDKSSKVDDIIAELDDISLKPADMRPQLVVKVKENTIGRAHLKQTKK